MPGCGQYTMGIPLCEDSCFRVFLDARSNVQRKSTTVKRVRYENNESHFDVVEFTCRKVHYLARPA
jgi:hypothetical protein